MNLIYRKHENIGGYEAMKRVIRCFKDWDDFDEDTDQLDLEDVTDKIQEYKDAYNEYAKKLKTSQYPIEDVVRPFKDKYGYLLDDLKQTKSLCESMERNGSDTPESHVIQKRIQDLFYRCYNFTEFSTPVR